MKYRLLGKSGLRVSELSLGTMTFGTDWNWGASKEMCKAILKAYTDEGGNFIDTANNYTDGSSEKIIGELTTGDRERYVIATKFTLSENKSDPNFGGNHRKNLLRSVKGSLKRLNTDYIDILYLHAWDYTTDIRSIMRGLNDLVSRGIILHIGFSDTPAWIIASANAIAREKDYEPISLIQFPYSVVAREPERELIPMATNSEIAMTSWGALEHGLLTGKYTREKSKIKGRLTKAHWGIPSEESLKLAKKIDGIADEIGVTSAQVAINWILNQKGVNIPIIGSTTVDQIKDSLGATEFVLSLEHMKKLNEIKPPSLGFPYTFLKSDSVIDLIFGKTYSQIKDIEK